MLKNNVLLRVANIKHEHSYNEKAASRLFRRVEGESSWYQLTQGVIKSVYSGRIREYYDNVILRCPGRIASYIQLQDQELHIYKSFMVN